MKRPGRFRHEGTVAMEVPQVGSSCSYVALWFRVRMAPAAARRYGEAIIAEADKIDAARINARAARRNRGDAETQRKPKGRN